VADIARLKKVLADSDAARRKADGKIQSLLTEYNELEAEIVQLEEGRNLSKRKIAGYKNEISKLEKLNQELPDPSKSGPELATVTKELEALHVEMRKLQDNEKLAMKSTSEKDLALQQKRGALGKLDSDRQVREDRFRSMSYELHNLLLWIRKSQSMFKGTVKGPLALEIQPKSEQAATLLEKLIPKNLLGAFLVTSPEDMDLIRKKGNELGVRCKKRVGRVDWLSSQLFLTGLWPDSVQSAR
jgi:chromosome segregation ATPase